MTTQATMTLAHPLFPANLKPGVTVASTIEVANLVVADSNAQVQTKKIEGDETGEFLLGCDALNFTRIRLRFAEDLDDLDPVPDVFCQVINAICRHRGYSVEEFRLSLLAVASRVRLPYGYMPLELASIRAKKYPVKLLKEGLQESQVSAQVAAVALHLQHQQQGQAILLPLEAIRSLLGMRKLVVSGALNQLVSSGVLVVTDGNFHSGKAKEFKFAGIEGSDYEYPGRRPPWLD
jgi:hypothetical protein